MITLAIDTATERACVAVVRDGTVLAEAAVRAARSQTEELMPLVDRVLGEAGITVNEVAEVVVGVGPGPFTGLRVGIVTGQMIGHALGVPVHGVMSLDACAVMYVAEGGMVEPFVVTIDAKRGEQFWAKYNYKGVRIDGPHVGANVQGLPGFMSAAALAMCANRVAPQPMYLREPDATIPGAAKKVLK